MSAKPGRLNANYQHGLSHSPEYRVWASMWQRCTNPNSQRWARYGGRGIRISDRWKSFKNFYADMGPRPPGMTLERENNDGHYTKRNCVWAPRSEQYRNRSGPRANRWLTDGKRVMCISDWAKHLGLSRNTFNYRFRKGQLPWLKNLI